MNKRQRKKNRTGEFTEYGFEVEVTLHDSSDFDTVIWNDFIPFVEKLNLGFGGGLEPGATPLVTGFVTGGPRGHERCSGCSSVHGHGKRLRSCTEGDRTKVLGFFSQHAKVESATAGPLVDAWR